MHHTAPRHQHMTIDDAAHRALSVKWLHEHGDSEAADYHERLLWSDALREIANGHPYPKSLAATVRQTLRRFPHADARS